MAITAAFACGTVGERSRGSPGTNTLSELPLVALLYRQNALSGRRGVGHKRTLASELGTSPLPLEADMLSVSITSVKCQKQT